MGQGACWEAQCLVRSRVSQLDAVGVWGWISTGGGGGLCIRGCLAAPQSSVHEVPVVTPLPPGDNPGSLQTLTSGPWKANLLPSGEH